jgi:Vacuolar protein 14 C-terminal Fig4p binding
MQDLEFASIMVQNLNIILVTSPELAELRKRLKNLESRVRHQRMHMVRAHHLSSPLQDGQILFTALYKSWCHNAVATFALCLLAQAYEHAASLLQTL